MDLLVMDSGSQDQMAPIANPDGQMEIWREMAAVERARIASRDNAVEVMREGFNKLDASDERYFKLEGERLRLNDAHRRRQFALTKLVTWAAVGAVGVTLTVLLFMTFWGNDMQQDRAATLTTYALSCGASVGLGYLLGKRSRA